MFDIEYDRDLDTVNIEVFERKGPYNDIERRFRCVCCKKPICIDESILSRGHRMVCWSCYLKYSIAISWLRTHG